MAFPFGVVVVAVRDVEERDVEQRCLEHNLLRISGLWSEFGMDKRDERKKGEI